MTREINPALVRNLPERDEFTRRELMIFTVLRGIEQRRKLRGLDGGTVAGELGERHCLPGDEFENGPGGKPEREKNFPEGASEQRGSRTRKMRRHERTEKGRMG